MIEAIEESSAAEQMKQMLESAAPQSLKRMIEVAADKKGTELGAKLDQAIVERFLGKPVQPIKQSKPIAEMTDEELRADIAEDEGRAARRQAVDFIDETKPGAYGKWTGENSSSPTVPPANGTNGNEYE